MAATAAGPHLNRRSAVGGVGAALRFGAFVDQADGQREPGQVEHRGRAAAMAALLAAAVDRRAALQAAKLPPLRGQCHAFGQQQRPEQPARGEQGTVTLGLAVALRACQTRRAPVTALLQVGLERVLAARARPVDGGAW